MEKITIKEEKNVQKKKGASKSRKNKPVNNAGRQRGDLGRRLLAESDYLKTIMDPLNVLGVQVPDEVTIPSSTMQCLQRLQVTATSDGIAGCSFIVGSLYGGGSDHPQIADIETTSSRLTALQSLDTKKIPIKGASPAPVLKPLDKIERKDASPGPSGAVGDYSWAPWDADDGEKVYAQQLAKVAVQGRVVSAGLYAFYEGTPLEMSGRGIGTCASRVETFDENNGVTAATIPQPTTFPGDLSPSRLTQGPPVNAADMLSQRMVTDRPLQACKGQMNVRFIPQDEGDRVYFPIYGPNGIPPTKYEQGRLTLLYEGLETGAVVEFWVVENWEFLPVSTHVNLTQPRPSHSDPLDLAITSNFLSERPFAAVAPGRVTQGARDGAVNAHHNGPVLSLGQSAAGGAGVMNTLIDLVEKSIPVAEKLWDKVGKPLLPIITALL
jgi:hypothetical protein